MVTLLLGANTNRLENRRKYSSPFVGQRIRSARLSAHLSLEMLGQLIGISNQALSAIERGKANPSKQTLMSLARTLNDDFEVPWLKPFVLEAGESPHWPGFSFSGTIRSQDIPNPEGILGECREIVEAATLPKPVGIIQRKTVNLLRDKA
jgi:transcriptional regulator with XRE-family HTH domain